MMNKEQSNQISSVRKKLLAALAMLLVACIMTVSSTYAWFTLSTAPEVKGITTTVGANGNLEMALANYDTFYDNKTPSSHVGSSMDKAETSVTDANVTWGNLVDLSDTSYGLGAIKLYPSRLNANANSLKYLSPLQYPSYGADGRIVELLSNTMIGKYDTTASGFKALATPNYAGVNGVGSASSMSARAFAVRNNKANVEANRAKAMSLAKGAITNYSGALAGLAINNQTADATTVVKAADIATLKNLITALRSANTSVSDSMKSAVQVVLAGSTLGDDAWALAVDAANGKDIEAYVSWLKDTANNVGVSIPTQVETEVAKYKEINTLLNNAESALPASGDGTWDAIEESVSAMLNARGILICGYTIGEIQSSQGVEGGAFDQVTAAVAGSGLTFTFSETSGVFADIAYFTGEYTATITFPEGTRVEGINLAALGAKPVTVKSPSANKASGQLGVISAAVADTAAPDADDDAEQALTDTYGYTIDLLFRTNATDSYLQLQTEGVNRVYEEQEEPNLATQGSGSNMTFTLNENYNLEKIKGTETSVGLAKGIRVVFYDAHSTATQSASIFAVAVLDVDNAVTVGDACKMNLKLVHYKIDPDGTITCGAFKTDVNTTPQDEAAALCALSANTPKKLSALVYLDGDVIDNSHAGVADDLDAMLNLQFASSANLKPMVNNDLQNMVADATTTAATTTETAATTTTVAP